MKSKSFAYVIAAVLLFTGGLIAASLFLSPSAAPPVAASDPVRAYRLEKLNEVNDMVLRREVVPEDYFYYLSEDEALCEALNQYNADTRDLINYYTHEAIGITNSLMYEHKESPGDYDQPQLYYDWVARITHLALYRNCEALCQADPVLGYTVAKETGGSYGLWTYAMHMPWRVGEELAQRVEDYFIFIDGLLLQMEDYRQTFS